MLLVFHCCGYTFGNSQVSVYRTIGPTLVYCFLVCVGGEGNSDELIYNCYANINTDFDLLEQLKSCQNFTKNVLKIAQNLVCLPG